MSKPPKKEEELLYGPIMTALQRVFSCLGECHLEISAKGFSDNLKKVFDDVALYMISVERFFPDISGFVKTEYSTNIITVEVKPQKPLVKHIFQTKAYAQIFNAKYAILISTKTFSEEKRRLILKRGEIISRYPREPVIIAKFDKITEKFEIDKELYYGGLPEPFKSNAKAIEAEQLEITSVGFAIRPERSLDTIISNKGTVTVELVEGRVNNIPLTLSVTVDSGTRKLIQLSKEWSPGQEYKIELITKNKKKVSLVTWSP